MLEGGCQGQALAAQGAQVGGLHGADVAFCRDGVVGKGVALGRDKHTHTHIRALLLGQSHTLPPVPATPAAALTPQQALSWTHPRADVGELIGVDVVPGFTQGLHS